MAEYKTRIDQNTGITFIEIIGVIDVESNLQYVNSTSFSERTSNVVFDVRQASLGDMPRGVLAKMVRTMRSTSRQGTRAAYVLNRGGDFRRAIAFLPPRDAVRYP